MTTQIRINVWLILQIKIYWRLTIVCYNQLNRKWGLFLQIIISCDTFILVAQCFIQAAQPCVSCNQFTFCDSMIGNTVKWRSTHPGSCHCAIVLQRLLYIAFEELIWAGTCLVHFIFTGDIKVFLYVVGALLGRLLMSKYGIVILKSHEFPCLKTAWDYRATHLQ